jgi:hypothetical protein
MRRLIVVAALVAVVMLGIGGGTDIRGARKPT